MPIKQTLDAASVNLLTFIDADLIRVGEAYARLASFFNGDATMDVFACDAGTYSAVRRAACRIVGSNRDKTNTYTEVQRSKNGKTTWKRLKRDETAKTNDVTRERSIKTYSADTVRDAIESLRNDHGVAIKRDATRKTIDGDEYLVVALVRETPAPVAS